MTKGVFDGGVVGLDEVAFAVLDREGGLADGAGADDGNFALFGWWHFARHGTSRCERGVCSGGFRVCLESVERRRCPFNPCLLEGVQTRGTWRVMAMNPPEVRMTGEQWSNVRHL